MLLFMSLLREKTTTILAFERKNVEAFLVLELCLLLYMINNDKKIQRLKLDVQNTNPL